MMRKGVHFDTCIASDATHVSAGRYDCTSLFGQTRQPEHAAPSFLVWRSGGNFALCSQRGNGSKNLPTELEGITKVEIRMSAWIISTSVMQKDRIQN